jgi:hypothetical protein
MADASPNRPLLDPAGDAERKADRHVADSGYHKAEQFRKVAARQRAMAKEPAKSRGDPRPVRPIRDGQGPLPG